MSPLPQQKAELRGELTLGMLSATAYKEYSHVCKPSNVLSITHSTDLLLETYHRIHERLLDLIQLVFMIANRLLIASDPLNRDLLLLEQ
jgi:hypothetical protein